MGWLSRIELQIWKNSSVVLSKVMVLTPRLDTMLQLILLLHSSDSCHQNKPLMTMKAVLELVCFRPRGEQSHHLIYNQTKTLVSTNGSIDLLQSFFISPSNPTRMCYFKHFIYSGCGHSRWGDRVAFCSEQSVPDRDMSKNHLLNTTCCLQHFHHPLHTLRFDRLCLACDRERVQRLRNLQAAQEANWNAAWNWTPETPSKWKGIGDLRMALKEKALIERGRIAAEIISKPGGEVEEELDIGSQPEMGEQE